MFISYKDLPPEEGFMLTMRRIVLLEAFAPYEYWNVIVPVWGDINACGRGVVR